MNPAVSQALAGALPTALQVLPSAMPVVRRVGRGARRVLTYTPGPRARVVGPRSARALGVVDPGRLVGVGQTPYNPPAYFDAGWASVFVAGCQSIGASPYDVAALIIGESGWNPGAENSVGCVGLNQICPSTYGIFSGTYTAAQYLALPVSQQLSFCFAYWSQVMKNHGLIVISGRDLYWLNWVPALYVPNAPDSYVIQTSSQPYYNAALDIGNKGYITAGDLQTRLNNMQVQNPALWAYLSSQITAAGGFLPSWPAMALGGVALGFAGTLLWNYAKTGRWLERAAF